MDPTNFNFPYTATQLTEQVNRIPNMFGMLAALNVFSSDPSASTLVEIRYEDGLLRVLPAKERGAPGTQAAREPGNTIFFPIPHFPHMDLITPKDIQDMLILLGMTKVPNTVDKEMAKRLLNIRNNHAITLEYIRMGALKGEIKDGNGQTLYNLFDEFSIEKKQVFFDLSNAATDIIAKCEEVYDHVLKNLKGEVSTGVEIIVGSGFMNKLVQHAKVKDTWLHYSAAAAVANMNRDRSGQNWGRVFEFGNIFFREYKGTFPVKANADAAVASVAAVDSGKGHAYPTGTMDTFKTWFGPANTLSAANKPGDEVFISPKVLDHDKGVEIWSESNPLALCKRPEVLVEVSETAAP
jgi:hypothetical protein